MKQLLLFLLSAGSFAQSMQITGLSAENVPGGINVNLQTISLNGAGYIGSTYSITGNQIDISACYWFNMTLPVLQFDHDIFVPIADAGEYTVNVKLYNSNVIETCDHFSMSDSGSTTILSSPEFNDAHIAVYPNPSDGTVYFTADEVLELNIYDNLGRQVRHFSDPESQLDLSGISSGIYYLNFETPSGTAVKKLIVK